MKTLSINDFRLENGNKIHSLSLAFETFGKLNENKDNVIWVCHALTANANVLDWWEGLFGTLQLFDPKEYFIVCVNSIGSCYGSTGPASPQENRRPLLNNFPGLTVRDAALAFDIVREHLGIPKINILIGASLGGQQALEWSILKPEVHRTLILIATNAVHSPFGIAFNESQRLAIQADATFYDGTISGGRKGLIAARSIALLSYRSYSIYEAKQKDENHQLNHFKAARYQQYQGEKLAKRFNAHSYYRLTKMMDSHNVGRKRTSIELALRRVKAKTLVIGITSDQLFPVEEQKFLAQNIIGAQFAEIFSPYGHDGFLVETEKISIIIEDFLHNNFKKFKPTVFRTTVRKTQLMNLVK